MMADDPSKAGENEPEEASGPSQAQPENDEEKSEDEPQSNEVGSQKESRKSSVVTGEATDNKKKSIQEEDAVLPKKNEVEEIRDNEEETPTEQEVPKNKSQTSQGNDQMASGTNQTTGAQVENEPAGAQEANVQENTVAGRNSEVNPMLGALVPKPSMQETIVRERPEEYDREGELMYEGKVQGGREEDKNVLEIKVPGRDDGLQSVPETKTGQADMQRQGLGKYAETLPSPSNRLFERRSPFVHNPPYPEERRPRIPNPRSPKDYIINLREDLADFQESHGLPRTRDYSFFSLGLSLAQETGRAIYAVFLMITELFPVIEIVSLILRFALDKLIEIMETDGNLSRLKKSVIFVFQMMIIMIPLWVLIGTIVLPLFYLIVSIFKRLFRISGNTGRKKSRLRSAPRRIYQAPPKAAVKGSGNSC